MSQVLASNVEIADTLLAQTVGLTGRKPLPDSFAMVFPLSEHETLAPVHMLGVRVPLDVLWITDERVTQKRTLRPWIGMAGGEGDTLIEAEQGLFGSVCTGDRVWLEDGVIRHEMKAPASESDTERFMI